MGIEPVSEIFHIPSHGDPSVACVGFDDELGIDTDFFQPGHHRFGLLNRDKFVGLAVIDQRGSVISGDEVNRRDLPTDRPKPVIVADVDPEVGLAVDLPELECGSESVRDLEPRN